eukprot:scaffold57216_cov35-Prasinocladus_malaysianus.AAC.1
MRAGGEPTSGPHHKVKLVHYCLACRRVLPGAGPSSFIRVMSPSLLLPWYFMRVRALARHYCIVPYDCTRTSDSGQRGDDTRNKHVARACSRDPP